MGQRINVPKGDEENFKQKVKVIFTSTHLQKQQSDNKSGNCWVEHIAVNYAFSFIYLHFFRFFSFK